MAEATYGSVSSDKDEGLCRFKCHCWDEVDLVKLNAENMKPDWWMNDFRICYRLLNDTSDPGRQTYASFIYEELEKDCWK